MRRAEDSGSVDIIPLLIHDQMSHGHAAGTFGTALMGLLYDGNVSLSPLSLNHMLS